VVGEQLFRLFPEPVRLLELFADQKRAGIERARDFLVDAEIDERADEEEERYRDPEFGLVDELHGHSLRAAATGAPWQPPFFQPPSTTCEPTIQRRSQRPTA